MIADATSNAPFARQLGVARTAHRKAVTAHTDAKAALAKAIQNSTVRTDLQDMFLNRATTTQHDADSYAKCLRAIADIVATLPALAQAVTDTEASIAAFADAVTTLERDACCHCHGTGLYQAPTSHTQNGLPLCWKCGGTAKNAKTRKATASA